MKKNKMNESIFKWIPGTKEFDDFAEESMKIHKKSDLKYKTKKLKELEELWRNTIKKAHKTWKDEWILSNAGVWTEKDLDNLMDELRKSYLDDSKPMTMNDKRAFISSLLQMLSILKYL